MDLSATQIIAIRRSDLLRPYVAGICQNARLLTDDIEALSIDETNVLHNAAYYALRNYSPIVEEHLAEQDKGAYAVEIYGVPGAYFVRANEYDDEGVFDSLDDARACVEDKWGEFLVTAESDSERQAIEDDSEEAEDAEDVCESISEALIAVLSGSQDQEANKKLRAAIESDPVLESMARLENDTYSDYPVDVAAAVETYCQTWPKPTGYPSGFAQLRKRELLQEAALLFYRVRGTVPTTIDLNALDLAM